MRHLGKVLFLWMVLIASAAGRPAEITAQVFTPSYLAPRGGGTLGVYASDTFNDAAIEAILRRGFGGFDVGLRGGVVLSDDPALLVGLDLRNPLQLNAAPLDFAFAGGFQVAVEDDAALGATAGLVVGSTLAGEQVSISPYLHPRIAIANANDETKTEVLADLGVDVRLQSNLVVKFALSFNDDLGSSFGFGVVFR